MTTLPTYPGTAERFRSLAYLLGFGGSGDGIDFARVGGILGIVSGIVGFVVGIISIVSGMLGIVGGILGVVASGILGIVAGGILGIVVGGVVGTVGTGIFFRDWNFRKSFSDLIHRAADRDAGPAASSLTAMASWRILRAASRLMPQAAGRRWLAEAGSFLSEAPVRDRRRAARNYLFTAPQVIAATWTSALTRRTRPTGSEPTDKERHASGDPCS
jgi:hypothetical protein